MDAGRIDKDDLTFLVGVDALNSMACGLRLVRDGGDLFADNAIQERGFARVRTPDQRSIAAVKC